jgi:hypothetical protein
VGNTVRRHPFCVGVDLLVLRDDEGGLEVEGYPRLRPGRVVRLTGLDRSEHSGRLALVATWCMVKLGADGPFYRGYCEWIQPPREPATRERRVCP